ncbi:aminopeptidase P N-terminal domain-containing protein [Candidatus Saccharibacteria bacterium]|nr:aminopeptidase P N-terminal domain-containing protein [Candidatus Saccharibacteria bacterium]
MKRLMNAEFFAENRDKTMEILEGGVLVASAYSAMQSSNDAASRFEQEGNFWYLTGIERPGWWLIMDGARGKSWLVTPDVDPVHALFDGSLSIDEATAISGIDEIITRSKADELLLQTARQHRLAYFIGQPERAEDFDFILNPAQREMHEKLARIFVGVQDLRPKLANLRSVKQPVEIKAIESAIAITSKALLSIRASFQAYKYEYEIEAELNKAFRETGGRGHAYDPIVAGGSNACTLHYIENNAPLKKRTLVLLDVGAQVEHYAADITRTYSYYEPTKRQREVHAAVQAAHLDIVAMLAPDLSVAEYGDKVDARMKQALIEVGLLSSLGDERYRQYFPHAISHGLGIDVHDSLGRPKYFEPNMVLTVEPGIYIPEEGIGVRIEDDILITAKGHRNLSQKLPTDL